MADLSDLQAANPIAAGDLTQPSDVPIARTAAELRHWTKQIRLEGKTIALVPTMGALHAGHMALIDLAKQQADRVIVSIFVNPLQFGPKEDFSAYPRQLQADSQLCAEHGVAAIFAPDADTMYPQGFQTHVEVEQLTLGLCGASRPGHFRGVTTVVLKLLNLVMADVAVFGLKDYQQLQAIRRMCLDLAHPTQICAAPIVREADGLALSSRNVYLRGDERQAARAISQALFIAQRAVAAGERSAAALQVQISTAIEAAGGKVDYAAIVHAESLQPIAVVEQPARAIVAAFFGRPRLLDNVDLFGRAP